MKIFCLSCTLLLLDRDATFTITGLKGAEHAARSRQPILDWVDERARFGFFEWHSHVYMLKNITPLVTLAELADDPVLVRAAGMAKDFSWNRSAEAYEALYRALT